VNGYYVTFMRPLCALLLLTALGCAHATLKVPADRENFRSEYAAQVARAREIMIAFSSAHGWQKEAEVRRLSYSSPEEALQAAHDTTSPQMYARFAAAVRFFSKRIPLPELVRRAGSADFESWLQKASATSATRPP
jgi:hypothetical protein